MDELKLTYFLITLGLVAIGEILMKHFKNALKLHLHIFSILWASLLLASCFMNGIYEISNFVFIIFCVAWLLMYFGTFVSYIFFHIPTESAFSDKVSVYNFSTLKVVLFVIVLLSIISNYFHYADIASRLDTAETLAALRTPEGLQAIEESSNMFFNTFGRMYTIYIPLGFLLYKQKEIKASFLIFIIVISFAIAAAALTRAPILFVFILIITSIYILRIKIKRIYIFLCTVFFGALLYAATNEINKLDGSSEGNASAFFGSLKVYFMGSLKAYDNLVNGLYFDNSYYESPFYSFDFINYFLKRFGFIESYPPLVRNYTELLETNVYTYLDSFTLDFGITGALICPFVIGFFCGFFSCRVKLSSNITWLVMYAYCCFCLISSFMNNEFIRSTVLIIGVFSFLIHLLAYRGIEHNEKI